MHQDLGAALEEPGVVFGGEGGGAEVAQRTNYRTRAWAPFTFYIGGGGVIWDRGQKEAQTGGAPPERGKEGTTNSGGEGGSRSGEGEQSATQCCVYFDDGDAGPQSRRLGALPPLPKDSPPSPRPPRSP